MSRTRTLLTVCFCAGLLGALSSRLLLWLAGTWGLISFAGVNLVPQLNGPWLYPQLVWGGLWGMVYFLTVGPHRSRRYWARKGLWVSLLPTAFQLFVIFPYDTPHGLLGMGLGQLTPLVILVTNMVWGFTTGIFCRLFWGRG